MVKRLAIIPARGGSKRIPNKNIRNFAGKPMISYIISQALKSNLFDKIHISTDSKDIIAIGSQYNLEPDFMRDKNLCDDITPIMPVLKFVTERFIQFEENFDQVWCLMACSPMISSSDLIGASEVMSNHGNNFPLLAVAEYPVPAEWAFKKNTRGELKPMMPGMFSVRSQDLNPSYFDAGAFSVFPTERILKSKGAGSDEGFLGYPISKLQAIDIDTEEDWDLAESLFKIV